MYEKYYQMMDDKFENKYSNLNFRFYDFSSRLYINAFRKYEKKPFYYRDNAVLFYIATFNNFPRYVNYEKLDLDAIAKVMFERCLFGFKKDRNPNYVAGYSLQNSGLITLFKKYAIFVTFS